MKCLPSILKTICILFSLPSSLSNAWESSSWYSGRFPGSGAWDKNFCNLLRVSFSRKGWGKQNKSGQGSKQVCGLTVQSHRELWSMNCAKDLVLSWGKGLAFCTLLSISHCLPAALGGEKHNVLWGSSYLAKGDFSKEKSELLAANIHSS